MVFWKLKIHAAQLNIGQGFWAAEDYALGRNDITYNSWRSPALKRKRPEAPRLNMEQMHNTTLLKDSRLRVLKWVLTLLKAMNYTRELGA